MSFVPAFEIGIWNAWILTVILYTAAFVPLSIDSQKADRRMEGEPKGSELEKVTRIAQIITHMIIMPFTFLYSIFLPLNFGTWWFYVGLLIYLLGLAMVLMSSIEFVNAPLGEPITKGVYAYSRNPMYAGSFFAYTGIGLACASWIFLLCALVWIVSWHFGVVEEEKILLAKYGEAYKQYMERTSRWMGLPKNV